MCLKLSCPVDCTTWLTHTGLISIQPACQKIHYRTAITYSPAQHKHWGSHAGKQKLQSQWAHLMVAVSLIIKTHSSSLKQRVCCLWSRKSASSLIFLCTCHSANESLIIQPTNGRIQACSRCVARVFDSASENRCASLKVLTDVHQYSDLKYLFSLFVLYMFEPV